MHAVDDSPSGSSPADRIDPDRFYTDSSDSRPRPLTKWANDPLKHAAVLTLLGVFGVFLEQTNIIYQIVIGAPVFEELLKFGVALGLVALFRVDSRVVLFLVAMAAGAGFGALEHYVTYPDEAMSAVYFRLGFHSGSTALSAAVYGAIRESMDLHARWAVTAPATVIHWLNNFVALALGVTSIATGQVGQGPALVFAQAMAALSQLLAWWALFAREHTERFSRWAWNRFAPASLKGPDPRPSLPG